METCPSGSGRAWRKPTFLWKARRRHSTPQKQSAGSVQRRDGSRFRSAGFVCRQPDFVHLKLTAISQKKGGGTHNLKRAVGCDVRMGSRGDSTASY